MKTKITLFVLVMLIIFSVYSISYADSFGTNLGNYNGVISYSNGSGGYVSNLYNYVNGTNTGMKWQCVEYVNRYYLIQKSLDIRIAGQNAVDYYPNASARGLISYQNQGNTSPEIGDVLCFSGGNPNYGHVAIIREIGSNYLKVIQQNVSQTSNDANYNINMTVSGGQYNVSGSTIGSGYSCQGWLRKPSTVSINFKFNNSDLQPNPNEYKIWKYPPIPNNYYTLTVTIVNKPAGETWDLYILNASGVVISDVALNRSETTFNTPFNVSTSNSSFPNAAGYKFRVNRQGTPGTVWGYSNPFYISTVPVLTVEKIPSGNLYIGQQAQFTWSITGGAPGAQYGGWTGNIQIQWHQNSTPLANLGAPSVSSSPFIFITPSSIPGGTIPGSNFKLSGSNPDGSSIPVGYVFAYTQTFSILNPSSINKIDVDIPEKFSLYENYPNPFNPSTNIKFDLPKNSFVKLIIYDILGKEIKTLINENLNAGAYKINWNSENMQSGIFFYRLLTNNYDCTKKMVLIK